MAVEELTFTVLERGRGQDPSADGYQVKACSPDLDPYAKGILASICAHYGQAVHDRTPPLTRDLCEREDDWIQSTVQTSGRLPDRVDPALLAGFPVIWSYQQIDRERWAVTQTRYLGFCPPVSDHRPGNFFTRALVFKPQELAPHAHNPMALRRTSLFPAADDHCNSTELASKPDLGPPATGGVEWSALKRYHARLPELVAALAQVPRSQRPVFLCVRDWRQDEIEDLVEGLLALLPPSRRCRTSVCTFENDRRWVPSGSSQPPGRAAHHLLVACGPEDGWLSLSQVDYASHYAVFNFVSGRFSDAPEPGAYARFACSACDEMDGAGRQRLLRLHEWIEVLGYGDDPASWDALADTAPLLDPGDCPRDGAAMLPPAVAALGRVIHKGAARPDRVRLALERLIPWLEPLAAESAHAEIEAVASEFDRLVGLLADGDKQAAQKEVIEAASPLAGDALRRERGRVAQALLRACGSARERVQREALYAWSGEPPKGGGPKAAAEDQKVFLDLLVECLRQDGPADAGLAGLVMKTLGAACAAGQGGGVWMAIEATAVHRLLGGPWGKDKANLTAQLLDVVTHDACPQGNAWLRLRRLENAESGDDMLRINEILAVAQSCASRADGKEMAEKLLGFAASLSPLPKSAVAFGLLAGAAPGELGKAAFERYARVMADLDASQRAKVRGVLAKHDAAGVLCRELRACALPWSEESTNKLAEWQESVLKHHPKVIGQLSRELRDLIGGDGGEHSQEGLWSLAAWFVEHHGGAKDAGDLLPLASELVMCLPLESPDTKVFSRIRDRLEPTCRARLDFLDLLREVESLAGKPEWSAAGFPRGSGAWRYARNLALSDRPQILEWIGTQLRDVGLKTREEAARLVQFLVEGGFDPEDVVVVVDSVIQAREDLCTLAKAQLLLAFTGCHLEGAEAKADWLEIVKAIHRGLDRAVQREAAEYFQHGFRQPGEKYAERLRQLRVALGIEKAAAEAEGTRPAPAKPGSVGSRVASAVSQVGRWFGLSREGRGEAAQAEGKAKPRGEGDKR